MDADPSDRVFVVPIGTGTPPWSTVSWRDSVNIQRRYYHPIGKTGWPKISAKWLGFRYDSRLQSIHRVEKVIRIECRSELSRYFPDIDGEACRRAYDGGERVPHFVYWLAAPQYPDHVVAAGTIIAARKVWAHLDLLLSSQSISQAVELSKQRDGDFSKNGAPTLSYNRKSWMACGWIKAAYLR
jgi:hypothetical protein